MTNCIERDIFVLRDASPVAQPVEYVQGTNAIDILLHIRDYAIPEGSTARVYVHRPSTKGEYDNAAIEGNSIRIDVKDTMFSEVGKSLLQVCIVNGEDTLVTFSHPVAVKKNNVPGIVNPSENKSDFLDEYLKNIEGKIEETNSALEEATELSNSAIESAGNAAVSEENAKKYMESSKTYASDAKASADSSAGSATEAAGSAADALAHSQNASASEKNAKKSEDAAALSEQNAKQSETDALSHSESAKAYAEQVNERIGVAVESAESALQSAENAEADATLAKSYAVGGTGTRDNEDADNARYYFEQTRTFSQGLNGIIPKGTTTFENLPVSEMEEGWMYNISNGFTSDGRFNDGGGIYYGPGNNVVWTADGLWDVTAASGVTGVKGVKESSYRQGNVELSAEDVGAVATDGDVAGNTVSYTEAAALAELTPGEKLGVAFGKIKLAVKNVIALARLMGSTDISKIGDGTCTGAINSLNSNLANTNGAVSKLNSDREWKQITVPNPTYNSEINSYSYNLDLSKYKEIEIRLWMVNYLNDADTRVVSLTPSGNSYFVYFYNGAYYNAARIEITSSFIVVYAYVSNMPSHNVFNVAEIRVR